MHIVFTPSPAIEAQLSILEMFGSGEAQWPEDGCPNLPGLGVVYGGREECITSHLSSPA